VDEACGAYHGVYNLWGLFMGEPEGNSHLEEQGLDGRVV